MPMLYGEGRKAFMRLQEEIVRNCPDLSIFAWRASSSQAVDHAGLIACSIFASTTVDFADSDSFSTVNAQSTNDFFISNQGIKSHTGLALRDIPEQHGYQYVFPVCKINGGTILGIRLRKCGASQLVREDPWTLVVHELSSEWMRSRTIYLLVRLPPAHFPKCLLRDIILHSRSHILQIVLPPEITVFKAVPWSQWDDTDQVFFLSENSHPQRAHGIDYAAAKLRGKFNFGPWNNRSNVCIDFMLYSLYWANTGSRKPLYTIIPWKPSNGALNDFNDRLEKHDDNTPGIERDLPAYKIEITSSAECDLADSGYSVKVDCSPHLVNDQTKCLVPFWKLEVSIKFVKNHTINALMTEVKAPWDTTRSIVSRDLRRIELR
jgi:hypothetical protein